VRELTKIIGHPPERANVILRALGPDLKVRLFLTSENVVVVSEGQKTCLSWDEVISVRVEESKNRIVMNDSYAVPLELKNAKKLVQLGELITEIAKFYRIGIDKEPKDSPFDQDSLRLFNELPYRSSSISIILTLLRLLAIPLLMIGAIGLAKVLLPTLRGGPEYDSAVEHFGAWILMLLLAGGVFAAGGILWFAVKTYTFEKAPLGSLSQLLLRALQ
jgi:hypothetical protein